MHTAIVKSWADVSFSPCSDLAVRIGTIVFKFEKWQSHLYCLASGKWAHISLTIPPSIFISPQSEKFLCWVSFTPPSSPVCTASVCLMYYKVCGWRNGVSVCPRGSSHTLLEGKGHTGLNTTQPSPFQAPPFHSLDHYSLLALWDSIVSLTHTPTNAQRGIMITKTWGGRTGCDSVFSPLVCLFWRTHRAHGIHMQLELFIFLFLSSPPLLSSTLPFKM